MSNIGLILIGIGIVGFAFFIFREIILWYWKINRIEELLEKIEKNTRKGEIGEEKSKN